MRNYPAISRKITRTLFSAQSLVSAAMIAMATVNTIIGAELSGVVAWAGVPAAVLLGASAIGALFWGFLMERRGRRVGLAIGLGIGVLGSFLSGWAVLNVTFLLFLVGMAGLGLAQSAMQLGRYAAADVSPLEARGRAIANVVVGGTVGSILGPLLVGPASTWATSVGHNELVGAYAVGLILFTIATIIIVWLLRPEPMEIARELAPPQERTNDTNVEVQPLRKIFQRPGVFVASGSMIIGQLVMVMLMVITSLHMRNSGFLLRDISIVIAAHTFGMFAFSIFSGRLTDRVGRTPVLMFGSLILVFAALTAGLFPGILPLVISLFLLGLGWNFCYVGGSTMLTDNLLNLEQSRVQGFNDLLLGLVSAIGSLGSGFVFAAIGYRAVGLIGAALAIIPFLLSFWWRRNHAPTTLRDAVS
ncbi:MAG: MFS transporter [Anaerolineales bacterium]